MPSKITDIDALKVTLSEDGVAAITGINYWDLRSILTAARLHRYDNPPCIKALSGQSDDIEHSTNMANASWHLSQGLIIDALTALVLGATDPIDGRTGPKIVSLKRSFEYEMKALEEDVRNAEIEAAKQAKTVDDIANVADSLQAALDKANDALADLNRLRRR